MTTMTTTELRRLVAAPTAPEPNPMPSGEPEDLATLLDDIRAYYERYIVFGEEHQSTALALWAMYTHCFAAGQPFTFCPYVLITSAEPQSGKSTTLECTEKIVPNPLDAQDVTPALLGRTVAGQTVLLDEIDGIYNGREASAESKAADLATILNSGYKKNGVYRRLRKTKGGDFEEQVWSTFGPKMLAGIGRRVPDAVQSRSIRLRLTRKTNDAPVQKARGRDLERDGRPLHNRMAASAGLLGELDYVDDMPDELGPRDQDNWEPLVSLARQAGPKWEQMARGAAIELTKAEPVMSVGMRLLLSIRDLFDRLETDFISTKDLLGAPAEPARGWNEGTPASGLCADEEAPWATYNRGRPISMNQMADLLAEYDIQSDRASVGAHSYGPKGFSRTQFEKAWDQYLDSLSDNPDRPDRPDRPLEV